MSEAQIVAARARAEAARDRLGNALGVLKQRLLPATIARNLAHDLADKGQDVAKAGSEAIRARPGVAAGAAALVALFLARKPIKRALIDRDTSSQRPETPTRPARSAADPAPRKAK